MLLVIDVGNTNITLGIFREEELVATFRLTTKQARTSDEYGVALCNLLEHRDINIKDIHAVIIASVVPDIMYSLNSAVVKYLDRTPLVVGPGIRTGLKLPTENPREIGADRVVDCVAAYELYGGPVIVMDFGTATTYDVVTKDGAFIAGITAPGIRSAGRTLWDDTAKLPEVEIKKPASILAQGDHQQYAGRHRVRLHRTDGIYHQPDHQRNRLYRCGNGGNRRSGQNYF